MIKNLLHILNNVNYELPNFKVLIDLMAGYAESH